MSGSLDSQTFPSPSPKGGWLNSPATSGGYTLSPRAGGLSQTAASASPRPEQIAGKTTPSLELCSQTTICIYHTERISTFVLMLYR